MYEMIVSNDEMNLFLVYYYKMTTFVLQIKLNYEKDSLLCSKQWSHTLILRNTKEIMKKINGTDIMTYFHSLSK